MCRFQFLGRVVPGLLIVAATACGPVDSAGISANQLVNGAKVTEIQALAEASDRPKTVYLQGTVSDRAPLLSGHAYRLQDESGQIWVITTSELPNLGEERLIQGTVRYQSIPVSGQELGERFVEETQVLERSPDRNASRAL